MRLETKRLLLREFTLEDVNDAYEYLSDVKVMQYIEYPFDRERTEKFIQECAIQYSLIFALVEKVSQKVIGHVIFHPFDSVLEYEIGWILNKDYQGKGYAYEISCALIDYAFKELKLEQIVAEADRNNEDSLSLLRKLDMAEEKERSANSLVLFIKRKETANTLKV